jgi:hypothetical protein
LAAVSAHSVTSPTFGFGGDVGLGAVTPVRAGLAGMARLRIDGGDHPISCDLASDPPPARPLTRLDILACHQRQQRDRLGLLVIQSHVADRLEHTSASLTSPDTSAWVACGSSQAH